MNSHKFLYAIHVEDILSPFAPIHRVNKIKPILVYICWGFCSHLTYWISTPTHFSTFHAFSKWDIRQIKCSHNFWLLCCLTLLLLFFIPYIASCYTVGVKCFRICVEVNFNGRLYSNVIGAEGWLHYTYIHTFVVIVLFCLTKFTFISYL